MLFSAASVVYEVELLQDLTSSREKLERALDEINRPQSERKRRRRSVGAERPDGKKILQQISKETGGAYFEVSKKKTVEDIYKDIQDDLRNQYSLGYTPDRPGTEADYRKIQVKVNRKDVTVQARDGYYGRAA